MKQSNAARCITAIGLALASHCAHACGRPAWLFPPAQSTVQQAQPLLRWAAVHDATAYRVRMASRVPEGRAIERIDTRTVLPQWALTSALRGEPRVKVSLEIEAECGTQISPPLLAEFLLEPPARCTISGSLGMTLRQDTLRWAAQPGSEAYEVCVTAAEGVTAAVTTCARPAGAQLTLQPAQQPPMLVSIAPVCAGVAGLPHFSAVTIVTTGSAARD